MSIWHRILRALGIVRMQRLKSCCQLSYTVSVSPPRKKPRSWSDKFYTISHRAKPKVRVKLSPNQGSALASLTQASAA